jgi:hypothetical protein
MWSSIVGALLGKVAPKVADYYIQKQKLKQEIELKKLEGKIAWEEAKTKRAEASEGRDHEWELLSIQNSGYKDEWVLFLLSIPMILSFYPATQTIVVEGFKTLEGTPSWYRLLIMIIFCAVYGVRFWRRKMLS